MSLLGTGSVHMSGRFSKVCDLPGRRGGGAACAPVITRPPRPPPPADDGRRRVQAWRCTDRVPEVPAGAGAAALPGGPASRRMRLLRGACGGLTRAPRPAPAAAWPLDVRVQEPGHLRCPAIAHQAAGQPQGKWRAPAPLLGCALPRSRALRRPPTQRPGVHPAQVRQRFMDPNELPPELRPKGRTSGAAAAAAQLFGRGQRG